MKIFALYIIALLFSFEALAYESAKLSVRNGDQQMISPIASDRNQQNVQQVSWSQTSSSIEAEVSSERRDKLFSGVLIYTLIILIYSLYWHKDNKPVD